MKFDSFRCRPSTYSRAHASRRTVACNLPTDDRVRNASSPAARRRSAAWRLSACNAQTVSQRSRAVAVRGRNQQRTVRCNMFTSSYTHVLYVQSRGNGERTLAFSAPFGQSSHRSLYSYVYVVRVQSRAIRRRYAPTIGTRNTAFSLSLPIECTPKAIEWICYLVFISFY